ncbi:MAG: hypothetical protein JNM93_00225 [Bacteriovoracaceae bacterium]|nr:hypothetical protein [Bacteriovoracaceae bacterium]
MNTKQIDLIAIVFLFFLAVWSGLKIIHDDMSHNFRDGVEIIAKIRQQDNTVKKKNYDFFSWLDAETGDELANNDLIYTYDKSTAEVEFFDGFEIALSENTLFKIEHRPLVKTLVVAQGIMHTQLTPKVNRIQFNLAGKDFDIRSQNAQLQIQRGKERSRITVLSGEAEITADNQKYIVGENQFLDFEEKSGKKEVLKTSFQMLSPVANQKFYALGMSQVKLQWRATEKVFLELADNSNFEQTKVSQAVEGNEFSTQLAVGTYYWRLSTEKMKGTIGTFHVIKLNAPEIISPEDGMKYRLGEKQFIRWKPQENIVNYDVEITSDIFRSQSETDETFTLVEFAADDYRLRIRGQTKSGEWTEWSSVRNFSVIEDVALETPIIEEHEKNYELVYYSPEVQAGSTIRLKWKKVQNAAAYRVQIKDEQGTLVHENESKIPGYEWEPKKAGEYDWSVQSINQFGRASAPTQGGKIKVQQDKSYNPETGATQIVLKKPDQMVNFEWDGELKGKEVFLFEVAEDSQFANVRIKRETSDNQTKFTFPKTGVFYWRTKKVLPNGKVEFSRPIKVKVQPTPPPQKLEIDSEIEVKIQKKTTSILWDLIISSAHAQNDFAKISWPATEEMKKYIVEIYKDEALKELVLRQETTKPELDWVNPPAGTFYWRVAQVDFWDQQSEFSNTSKLIVMIPEDQVLKGELELIYPEHKQTINDDQEELEFSWDKIENVKTYQLEISNTENFENIVLAYSVEDTKIPVAMKKLARLSVFYWRVSVKGNFSQVIQSEVRKGGVLKVEKPEAAPVVEEKKVVETPKKKMPKGTHPRHLDHYDFIQVSLKPAMITMTVEDEAFDGEITGMAMNSLSLKGRHMRSDEWFYDYELVKQSGAVFDGQSAWNNSSVTFEFAHPTRMLGMSFIGKFGLQANYASSFIADTNQILLNEDLFLFSGILEAEFEFGNKKNVGHHLTIGAAGGQLMQAHVEYEMRWYNFDNFLINTGIRSQMKMFDSETASNTILENQFFVGISFFFPPKWDDLINKEFWMSKKAEPRN